jgi:hypothetical protein
MSSQLAQSVCLHPTVTNPLERSVGALSCSNCCSLTFCYSSLLREPKPFKCSIKPRSAAAEKVITALEATVSLDNDA